MHINMHSGMLTRSPSLLAKKIAKRSMCNSQKSAYVLLAPLGMNIQDSSSKLLEL